MRIYRESGTIIVFLTDSFSLIDNALTDREYEQKIN